MTQQPGRPRFYRRPPHPPNRHSKQVICHRGPFCAYLPGCYFSHSVQEMDFYQLCHTKNWFCYDEADCLRPKEKCKYSHNDKKWRRYQSLISTEVFTVSQLYLCSQLHTGQCDNERCPYSHSIVEFKFAYLCYSKNFFVMSREDIFYASKFLFDSSYNFWCFWFY